MPEMLLSCLPQRIIKKGFFPLRVLLSSFCWLGQVIGTEWAHSLAKLFRSIVSCQSRDLLWCRRALTGPDSLALHHVAGAAVMAWAQLCGYHTKKIDNITPERVLWKPF